MFFNSVKAADDLALHLKMGFNLFDDPNPKKKDQNQLNKKDPNIIPIHNRLGIPLCRNPQRATRKEDNRQGKGNP